MAMLQRHPAHHDPKSVEGHRGLVSRTETELFAMLGGLDGDMQIAETIRGARRRPSRGPALQMWSCIVKSTAPTPIRFSAHDVGIN